MTEKSILKLKEIQKQIDAILLAELPQLDIDIKANIERALKIKYSTCEGKFFYLSSVVAFLEHEGIYVSIKEAGKYARLFGYDVKVLGKKRKTAVRI